MWRIVWKIAMWHTIWIGIEEVIFSADCWFCWVRWCIVQSGFFGMGGIGQAILFRLAWNKVQFTTDCCCPLLRCLADLKEIAQIIIILHTPIPRFTFPSSGHQNRNGTFLDCVLGNNRYLFLRRQIIPLGVAIEKSLVRQITFKPERTQRESLKLKLRVISFLLWKTFLLWSF